MFLEGFANMDADPRVPVGIEIDKVLDKFSHFDKNTSSTLDDLLEKLQDLENQLENIQQSSGSTSSSTDGSSDDSSSNSSTGGPLLSSEQVSNMSVTLSQVKDMCASVSSKHRELHSIVSKVGKAIDKNFENSYEFMRTTVPFLRDETRPKLHEIICNHLCREGMQDTAEQLVKDSSVKSLSEFTKNFQDVNHIVTALRRKELQPAMDWVAENKEKLDEKKSCLEFKLHRLGFICMLEEGSSNIAAAVEYARNHLTPYINQHAAAIQQAMGALVFMRCGLTGTPYGDLLEPSQWDDVIHTFTKDACTVKGLASNSPLAICVNAGCLALPVLLNIKQALSETQVHSMWNGEEELPIEINLGDKNEYHSIFACPILRQQSTESNPPMRLACGHIISKDALSKLTLSTNKLKCPYCPVEQGNTEPKQIVF